MTAIPQITLNNGQQVPQFGFGVFLVKPEDTVADRIRENIDIFDFGLSAAEVEAISALYKNQRTGPDPDKFDAI